MSIPRVNLAVQSSATHSIASSGRRSDALHILNRHLGDENPQVITQLRAAESNQEDYRGLKKRCRRGRAAHSIPRHLKRPNTSSAGQNSSANCLGALGAALRPGDAVGFLHHPVDSRHRRVILPSWTDCHSIFAGCEGFCSAGGGRRKKRKT